MSPPNVLIGGPVPVSLDSRLKHAGMTDSLKVVGGIHFHPVGERKIMNHFVVTWYLLIHSAIGIGAKFAQAAKTFSHGSTEFAKE